MPRATEPHSPELELAARRLAVVPGVLTPELEAFMQSGVSVIIGVAGAGTPPLAAVGCGCRVLPGGRVRLLLMRRGNETLLDTLADGGGIAATFSRPHDHRSIQVKSSGADVRLADEQDGKLAVSQQDGLRRELISVNYSPAFASAYCAVDEADIVAIDFTPEAAFVQTPGPSAGEELKP